MAKQISILAKTEAQLQENEPIYLIELVLTNRKSGVLVTFYFTDSNIDIKFPTIGGNTYKAWGFSFSEIKTSLTSEVDSVNVSFDNVDLAFSTSYLTDYEFQGNNLTLKRVFKTALNSAADSTILFKGEIGAPSMDENNFAISVLSLLNKLDALLPRRLYQSNCHWRFGGTECRASFGTKTGRTTTGCSQYIIYDRNREEVDNYWNYGTLEFTDGACKGEKRYIKDFIRSESKIVVTMPFSAVPSEDWYKIKRGCNKTTRDCGTKFVNWINFGGFVAIPERKIEK